LSHAILFLFCFIRPYLLIIITIITKERILSDVIQQAVSKSQKRMMIHIIAQAGTA